MDNFEIEVLEDDQEENEPVQLPLNFLTIGEIENDDVKVYIKQDVYKALEEYAASDVNHELGTIILGQYSEEMGKMHVIISDYILAKYTDASASTLTFTHETWDYVHKEHDEKYPDKKIVGWQHTHPGYGIFLSNYDMFIQENFFNIPFQVAYVIDPVQHLRGFFQWKGGKVEKLKGFYIYDDLGKTIKIDQPKVKKNIEGDTKTVQGASKLHIAATAVLALLTIFLLFTTASLSRKYSAQMENQELLQGQLASQNLTIAEQAEELASIKGVIEKAENPEESVSEPNQSTDVDTPTNEIANEDIKHESVSGLMYFKPYIVQPGDSLLSICKAAGIDYYSTYRIILAVSGIDNANEIYVGQTVMLPTEQ